MTSLPASARSSPPDSTEWRSLLAWLAAYARRRLRDHCRDRAEDIAQEAALAAWQRAVLADEPCVTRLALCRWVNGLAVNENRRHRYQRETSLEEEDVRAVAANDATPEEALLARETRETVARRLRARTARDAVATQLLELSDLGERTAAEQVAASALPMVAIRNGRKRLSRAARRLAREGDALSDSKESSRGRTSSPHERTFGLEDST
jgi:DNA-directed RNA polymerase specialized sigma24 family protein